MRIANNDHLHFGVSFEAPENDTSEAELSMTPDSTRPIRRTRYVSRRLLSAPRPPSSIATPNVETDSYLEDSDSLAPRRRTRSQYARKAQEDTNENSIYFDALSDDENMSLESF
jgi:hypothetical protein